MLQFKEFTTPRELAHWANLNTVRAQIQQICCEYPGVCILWYYESNLNADKAITDLLKACEN
jgi:hypothetical protein